MVPAETRRLIDRNTVKIRESERRVALFWERRRVPWPMISGGSGESSSEPVKLETLCERLHSGELVPLTQSSAWAGRAVEPHTCVICGTGIARGQIEYEPRALTSAARFTHLACFNLWLAASRLG